MRAGGQVAFIVIWARSRKIGSSLEANIIINLNEKMIKFSSDECDWPMIKEEFMRRGFTTMLKEKSWNTFIASFGENYGTVKS